MSYYLKHKKVIIYGAGDVGKRMYDLLENNNVTVDFFVDKRASVYKEYQGKDVHIPDYLNLLEKKSDFCILIAFKNVFQHEQIAKRLQEQGFVNIIYQPYSALLNQCDDYSMNEISKIHKSLTDDEIFFDGEIPSIEMKLVFQLTECKTSDIGYEDVLLYIPSELLFENKDKLGSCIAELCMLSSYPSVKLFECFQMKEKKEFQKVVRFFIDVIARPAAERNGIYTDEEWERNVIEGRKAVFDEMNKSYCLDPFFFRDHCIKVTYSKENKFIISSSGKNRVSFLMAKGNRFIPVTMSKNDYNIFVNRQMLAEITNKILDKKFIAPILHPYFYQFPVIAEDYGNTWLKQIGNYISCLGFQEKNHFGLDEYYAITAMKDQGTTYRFLKRMNIQVQAIFRDNEDRECAELVNKLENMESCTEAAIKKKQVDFLCIDSQNKDFFDENAYEVQKMVFLQIWDDDMKLMEILQKKGFCVKEHFFTSLWGGKYVRGFCLEKSFK